MAGAHATHLALRHCRLDNHAPGPIVHVPPQSAAYLPARQLSRRGLASNAGQTRALPSYRIASSAPPQDERRRHFLGRLVELQPRYAGPTGLQSLSRGAPVFATFTNAAPVYVEQLLNWAFHLRELGLPHVVVCLDPESEDIAASNGIPWVAVQNQTTSEDVRNDHATFRAMVSRKVRLLLCC